MDACYIARRNAISMSALELFQEHVAQYLELREVFVTSGVRDKTAVPRQHTLSHYFLSIQLFGSPNGLCSSITKSKHKESTKGPWRWSNRYNPLPQMLRTLLRLEKITALSRIFASKGMLHGTTASYMESVTHRENTHDNSMPLVSEAMPPDGDEDGAPLDTACEKETLLLVVLSTKKGASICTYNHV